MVILLIDSNTNVACASYRVMSDDSVEFKRVYVKPQYRRRGIASELLKELEKNAKQEGYKHSFIITGKNNLPAIGLYEKLNYHKIANIEGFEDDNTVISMRKDF